MKILKFGNSRKLSRIIRVREVHTQFTHQHQKSHSVHSSESEVTLSSLIRVRSHTQFTHQSQKSYSVHSSESEVTLSSLIRVRSHTQFTHFFIKCNLRERFIANIVAEVFENQETWNIYHNIEMEISKSHSTKQEASK